MGHGLLTPADSHLPRALQDLNYLGFCLQKIYANGYGLQVSKFYGPILVASSGYVHPAVQVSDSPSLSTFAPVTRSVLIQAKKDARIFMRTEIFPQIS